MREVMNIIENGTEVEVEVLMSFKVEETGKKYVVYKKEESNGDMDIIYTSSLVEDENGNYTLEDVTDEEWSFIKEVMANVVNNSEGE